MRPIAAMLDHTGDRVAWRVHRREGDEQSMRLGFPAGEVMGDAMAKRLRGPRLACHQDAGHAGNAEHGAGRGAALLVHHCAHAVANELKMHGIDGKRSGRGLRAAPVRADEAGLDRFP